MFYSKKTEYLIRALLVIGDQHPERHYISIDTIRKTCDLPRALTLKLLHSAVQAGILESEMGKTGGYRFKKDPAKVMLFDVKRLNDPVHHLEGCALGLPFCSETNPCALHNQWKSLREPLLTFFANTPFSTLIEEYRRNNKNLTNLPL